jgi:hypothetical protein
VLKDAADNQKQDRKSMRFDGFPAWKTTGEKHRDVILIGTVSFAELDDKVFLFEDCSENDPEGPEHVE